MLTMQELETRIGQMQAFWRDRGLKALTESCADPEGMRVRYADPFGAMRYRTKLDGSETAQDYYSKLSTIIAGMWEHDEFPQTMKVRGGILSTLEEILNGTVHYVPARNEQPAKQRAQRAVPNKPVRLTILNRNKYHNEFMNQACMGQDLKGLIHWLRYFYCERYLKSDPKNKGKMDKAFEIISFMDAMDRANFKDINEYLSYVPEGDFQPLAQIIGENRISNRASKTPWGLQKIIDDFGYVKKAHDTSARVKAVVVDEIEAPDYTPDFY